MIHLSPDEKILMVLHRHWIVMFNKLVLIVFLLIIPYILPIMSSFLPIISSFAGTLAPMLPFAELLYVIYSMIVILIMFIFWMVYYLDVWIITSDRIIDVRQLGLFNREISEFLLSKVQDVTIDVPNFTATFLKYGNIIVHTGEGGAVFKIEQIPNVYEAKNLILDYSKKVAIPK